MMVCGDARRGEYVSRVDETNERAERRCSAVEYGIGGTDHPSCWAVVAMCVTAGTAYLSNMPIMLSMQDRV